MPLPASTIVPAAMSQRSFHLFAGTRPEVVKLAPVVHALRARGAAVVTIATGQQSDPRLTDATFAAANLKPDVVWNLGDDGYSDRAGHLYGAAVEYLASCRADAVAVVQGDTSTVPLVAHAARRAERPVVHVEAGLRSLNQRSQEETNRKMAAAAASIHFAPTPLAAKFLRGDGVDSRRIFVVGNTACDAMRLAGVQRVPIDARCGVVMTAHRATNVDDPVRLAEIVRVVADLASITGRVVFPIHPRTRDRLRAFGLTEPLEAIADVELCDPLPYDRMLAELAAAKLIVTDSGGLQEEAAWLGVPCVVMRRSTPRWEGVLNGTAVLCGVSRDKVVAAANRLLTPEALAHTATTPCPYGDGHSAEAIADTLVGNQADELLRLVEPDFTAGQLPAIATTAR